MIDRESEDAVRLYIDLIKHKFEIIEVHVFGSRARGTHRPDSDLDFAIIVEEKPSGLKPTFYLADEAYRVMEMTGIVMSAVLVAKSEWLHPETAYNRWLIETIRREGVEIKISSDKEADE